MSILYQSRWDYNNFPLRAGTMGTDLAKQYGLTTILGGATKQSKSVKSFSYYYVAGTSKTANSNLGLLNGIIDTVVAEDGGHAAIAGANGTLLNGIANSGGSLEAVGQGTVLSATITTSAALFAGSITGGAHAEDAIGAGTAIDPHIASGGYALTGGGASGFVVKGYRADGSGGLISGGTFESGSRYLVGSGGSAWGGTIAGEEYVLDRKSVV